MYACTIVQQHSKLRNTACKNLHKYAPNCKLQHFICKVSKQFSAGSGQPAAPSSSSIGRDIVQHPTPFGVTIIVNPSAFGDRAGKWLRKNLVT